MIYIIYFQRENDIWFARDKCLARASEQAADIGQSLSREVVYLFIHSVLHLLGMDHIDEADKEMMRSFEKKVVKKLYG